MLGFALVLLVATRSAVAAAADLRQAEVHLRGYDATAASAQQLEAQIEQAQVQAEAARHRMSTLPVRMVSAVPLLGRSWRAEEAVVRAAAATLDATRAASGLLTAARGSDGHIALPTVAVAADRMQTTGTRARASLEALRSLRTGLTPPQVRRGVIEASSVLLPVVDKVLDGAAGARLAHSVLGGRGRRTLVIALQNNAELRGTGGYASTFATGVAQDGRVHVEPLRDMAEIRDPPGLARRVPAPPDFVEDFGTFKADTTALVNWGMTPDVPTAAAVLSQAVGRLLNTSPDLVLLLDVPALAGLAELTGGVTLPDGGSVTPEELSHALLVDAYARGGVRGQDARRAALRQAATNAVRSMLNAEVPPLSALRELSRLASARHLALWSARKADQDALMRFGLAGQVPRNGDDLLCISINNFGANKLDFYVDRSVSHEAVVHSDRSAVLQRLVLRNRTPPGLVPYVAGRSNYGRLTERVQFDIPDTAQVRALIVNGRPAAARIHRANEPRTRVSTDVIVERGDQVTIELRYDLPAGANGYALHVVPQPLAHDASLHVSLHRLKSSAVKDATFERTSAFVNSETLRLP